MKNMLEKSQGMIKILLNFAEKVRSSSFGRFFFRKDLKKLPPASSDIDEKDEIR